MSDIREEDSQKLLPNADTYDKKVKTIDGAAHNGAMQCDDRYPLEARRV